MLFKKGQDHLYRNKIKSAILWAQKSRLIFAYCTAETLEDILNILYEYPDSVVLCEVYENEFISVHNITNIFIHKKINNINDLLKQSRVPCENNNYIYGFLFYYNDIYDPWIMSKLRPELIKYLPANYTIKNIIPYHNNEYGIPVYAKIKLTNNKKVILVISKGGYGDTIKVLPVVAAFVQRKKQNGLTVTIAYTSEKSRSILQDYLPDVEFEEYRYIKKTESYHILLLNDYCCTIDYQEYYNLNSLIILNGFINSEPIDEISKALNVPLNDNMQIPVRKASISTIGLLDNIKKYKKKFKKIIGVQFETYNNETAEQEIIIHRSWEQQNIIQFFELCNKNNIFIVNLCPSSVLPSEKFYDVSHICVTDLFDIISELDAIVGIDSCCAHIAGVLRIPNIVMYPGETEVLRSLSMNYSFVSLNGNINEISPMILFQRMNEILSFKRMLEKSIINQKNHQNSLNVEWV